MDLLHGYSGGYRLQLLDANVLVEGPYVSTAALSERASVSGQGW